MRFGLTIGVNSLYKNLLSYITLQFLNTRNHRGQAVLKLQTEPACRLLDGYVAVESPEVGRQCCLMSSDVS